MSNNSHSQNTTNEDQINYTTIDPVNRKKYHLTKLSEKSVNPDPYEQFETWYKESFVLKYTEPAAMHLATADKNGDDSRYQVIAPTVQRPLLPQEQALLALALATSAAATWPALYNQREDRMRPRTVCDRSCLFPPESTVYSSL